MKQEKERAVAGRSAALAERERLRKKAVHKQGEVKRLESNIEVLEQSMKNPLEPLPIDFKEHIRAFLELWGCPVTLAWCMENVAGVNDEETARTALHELACDLDVLVDEDSGTYELTGPQSFERDMDVLLLKDSRNRHVAVSKVRQEYMRLLKEVYKKMPLDGTSVNAQWIARSCPEVGSSQRATAIMRFGLETGYFDKEITTVGSRTETRYIRLAMRRTEEETRAAMRSHAVSQARLKNEHLAREIYEKVGNGAPPVTTRWVVQQGLLDISTTQKAAAVLRVAVELGLFEKIVETKGEDTIVSYRKNPGK